MNAWWRQFGESETHALLHDWQIISWLIAHAQADLQHEKWAEKLSNTSLRIEHKTGICKTQLVKLIIVRFVGVSGADTPD